jgi:hypothetical protein
MVAPELLPPDIEDPGGDEAGFAQVYVDPTEASDRDCARGQGSIRSKTVADSRPVGPPRSARMPWR